MGREIRRVPADWEHPKDASGEFTPMHKHFTYNEEEIEEGLRDGWLKGDPPFYGVSVAPQWPEEERTHFQVYETVSEGTPVTPHFATKAELIDYLVEHGTAWDYGVGWSRKNAEAFAEREWAPSMIIAGGKIYTPKDGMPT